MQHGRFLDRFNIAAAFAPIDLAGQANNGDWISLRDYQRVLVVLFKEAGVAGEDPVFTLRQAQDNAGTGAKVLAFDTIHEKVGADLTAIGTFTKVEQAEAGSYTNAVSGEAQAMIAVEIRAEDLDVENGFDHLQLQVPDTGATAGQLGCGFYILLDPNGPAVSAL